MTPATLTLQAALAQQLADALPADQTWEHALVNYELGEELPDEGGPQASYLAFYLVRAAGNVLVVEELRPLPADMHYFFQDLRRAMATDEPARRWGTAELTLSGDGRYRLTFDYNPPKRLNGILDEDSYDRFRADRYLAAYATGRG